MDLAFWVASAFGFLIAYLFGSIPTGYLAGRLLRGIDLRQHGSGSTGATNVLRTLGKWPALFVLLIDVLKGAAAIIFTGWYFRWLSSLPFFELPVGLDIQVLLPWAICFSGLAVLVGHGRSVWLKFSGGKSAAAGLGVLLALSLPVGLVAATVWGLGLVVFRIVSLSSILAAVTAVVVAFGYEHPLAYRLLVAAGAFYVIVRHRSNMQRLLAGTEPRLGQTGSASRPSK